MNFTESEEQVIENLTQIAKNASFYDSKSERKNATL